MSYGKFEQGYYEVVNKEKYIGNHKPIYRSSWERRVMFFLDSAKSVIKWSSERTIIPYKLPNGMGTGKVRRYFVDFYCEILDNNGIIQKYLVEVKPKAQTLPPKQPKSNSQKRKERYVREALTYVMNQCKWSAAEQYCKLKGYKFIKLTEDDIFNNKI